MQALYRLPRRDLLGTCDDGLAGRSDTRMAFTLPWEGGSDLRVCGAHVGTPAQQRGLYSNVTQQPHPPDLRRNLFGFSTNCRWPGKPVRDASPRSAKALRLRFTRTSDVFTMTINGFVIYPPSDSLLTLVLPPIRCIATTVSVDGLYRARTALWFVGNALHRTALSSSHEKFTNKGAKDGDRSQP